MSFGVEQGSHDPGSSHKVLRLLDALRRTSEGTVLYRQIERILRDTESTHFAVERAYAALASVLLDTLAERLQTGSPLQIQIKLLRTRIQPPLSVPELDALKEYVERYSEHLVQSADFDAAALEHALSPLLQALGLREEAAPIPPARPEATTAPIVAPVAPPAAPPVAEPREPEPEPEAIVQIPAPPVEPPPAPTHETYAAGGEAEQEAVDRLEGEGDTTAGEDLESPDVQQRLASVYRHHLDAKRKDIQKLQASLAQQVLETITQNEEFGVLLEVVLGELRQTRHVHDMEQLRESLIEEIVKLLEGHNLLADKLDSTYQYLQVIESDSRQLTDELTRVRLLSLTDELTGLPNRRAFLRRLEDEVGRVQRYGLPLSLALIDLDMFKEVNDRYGHAAGDEVLRVYSKNILSIFRHHDLVARYGGEEFAVLLPNTDKNGALRALAKVKKRSTETRWQSNGTVRHVPTFSAGLALYKPGETPGAFIERADNALYRAKRLGRDRVELDATYVAETAAETGHDREAGAPSAHSQDH